MRWQTRMTALPGRQGPLFHGFMPWQMMGDGCFCTVRLDGFACGVATSTSGAKTPCSKNE